MGMRSERGRQRGESGMTVGDKNKIDMPHRSTVRGQERLPLPHPLSFFLVAPLSLRSLSNGHPYGVQWDVQR